MNKRNKYMGATATQELINLVKADFAKKQDIIQYITLPDPANAVGRVYWYVGETNRYYSKGHLYKSTGFEWVEVYKALSGRTWDFVDNLPAYDDADFDTLYIVPDLAHNTFALYLKGDNPDEFIALAENFKVTCYDANGNLEEHDVLISDAHFKAITDNEIDEMFEV